jgi:tetratricopeptide (TPR) repeat protein
MLYETRKDRDSARRAYEQALVSDPHAGVAANNLAWIYAGDGKLDEALELATIAQASLRNRPEPEDTLGLIYLKRGMTSKAIDAFERARDRAPRNPLYHYHLGLAHCSPVIMRRPGHRSPARCSCSPISPTRLTPAQSWRPSPTMARRRSDSSRTTRQGNLFSRAWKLPIRRHPDAAGERS